MGGRHISVLFGGKSLERDISVKTGHRVIRALEAKGYKVTGIDVDANLVRRLDELRPDGAFIAMHGKGGEDGTVQELLEILGIPYTGSGVLVQHHGDGQGTHQAHPGGRGHPDAGIPCLQRRCLPGAGGEGLPGDHRRASWAYR